MVNVSRLELVRGGGAHTAFASAAHERTNTSAGRATVLVGILLAMSLAVAIALLEDWPLGALELLLVVPILAGVLAVAWMRPASRSPEHHPNIDRLLDDTDP
jgi:hypothetical protein